MAAACGQDITPQLLALKSPLAAPAFTGVPTAPTAANTVATTQLATCAFVKNKVNAGVPASATAAGNLGDIAFASGFAYFCIATNTWQRVVIATW